MQNFNALRNACFPFPDPERRKNCPSMKPNNCCTKSTFSILLATLLHIPRALVVLLAVEDSEDRKEQVDNVEVEANGSCDLLLDVVVSHNELSIH